jgi:uncharacterized protein
LLLQSTYTGAPARKWLENIETDKISFCRVTQMCFLRLLTNPRVIGRDVLTVSAAWNAFDAFALDTRVDFATEPVGFQAAWRKSASVSNVGPNFWTDAYLASFATVSDTHW